MYEQRRRPRAPLWGVLRTWGSPLNPPPPFQNATALARPCHHLENATYASPPYSLPLSYSFRESWQRTNQDKAGHPTGLTHWPQLSAPLGHRCGLKGATLHSRPPTDSEVSQWQCNGGRALGCHGHLWALLHLGISSRKTAEFVTPRSNWQTNSYAREVGFGPSQPMELTVPSKVQTGSFHVWIVLEEIFNLQHWGQSVGNLQVNEPKHYC